MERFLLSAAYPVTETDAFGRCDSYMVNTQAHSIACQLIYFVIWGKRPF